MSTHAPDQTNIPNSPTLTLTPPHPLARVTPFKAHPSTLPRTPLSRRWNFQTRVSSAHDAAISRPSGITFSETTHAGRKKGDKDTNSNKDTATGSPVILSPERRSNASLECSRPQPELDPGGVDIGGWYTFNDPEDRLSPSALALFADLYPSKLVAQAFPGLPRSWFPTITLSIQFFAPVPRVTATGSPVPCSDRTVGVWATEKFVQDPQGRHAAYVEV